MRKKKLLWLLPYFPYPLLSGGNVRVFNLIKHLGKKIDIDLLSFIEPGTPENDVKQVKKYCRKVKVVERKLYTGKLPLVFQEYFTPQMRNVLKNMLKKDYDLIQIDYLTMAYYAKMIKELSITPLVFTEHDVSWFDFDKCFHNRHLDNRRRYYEWIKMRGVAEELYSLFDAVITVSSNDARILKKQYSDKTVFSAPTGTDCSYYAFREGRRSFDMVYTGHFGHYPNLDSVNFFLKKIFPLIRRNLPNIKFRIVGSGGKGVFPNLEINGVKVTGTVKDIRGYLYNSGVFIAPLRLGVGIRGKILEAMATGLPVVTTKTGADGIGAKNGVHLLVANEPDSFASCVERITKDNRLSRKLAWNARRFVEKKFDWKVRADELYEIYDNCLCGKAE